MNFVIDQNVTVDHVIKGEDVQSKGRIVWDYGNGVYDIETESGQIVHQEAQHIFPIAEYIEFKPSVDFKGEVTMLSQDAIREELEAIEARKKYLLAVKDEQPAEIVESVVSDVQEELTPDHDTSIFEPAIETEENNQSFEQPTEAPEDDKEQKATELIRAALNILENSKEED